MFILKPKAYLIPLLFTVILSSCTSHNIVTPPTQQIDTNQSQGTSGNITYKNPTLTFFPFLLRESSGNDAKIDLSLEFNPLETKSGTYLPSGCIGERPSEIKEECVAYTKIYKDFLRRYSLSGTENSNHKKVRIISETKITGNNIHTKYAVGLSLIDPINVPFVASWYAKNYTFNAGDFVQKAKNIGWLGEDTDAITVPILSENKHFIMTSDVTAISKSGNTYGQAIFENIPLSFESGTVVNISLVGEEKNNILLNSLTLKIPYVDNLKGGLLKYKSGNNSILKMKIGINQINEADALYCNIDVCEIHFSSGIINDIQELQFQYY